MTRRLRILPRLGKAIEKLRTCERGVYLVEFAFALPVLLMFLLGGFEIGYRIYAIGVVNGSMREAARMASTGSYTEVEIDNKVKSMIKDFNASATTTIVKKSYSDFTGVGLPEPITSGTLASGKYCYQDINNNGTWNEDRGTSGLGEAEDVVYYEVTMKYNTLLPFTQAMFGFPSITTIKQNTIVSNEPYAAVSRLTPSTRCVG